MESPTAVRVNRRGIERRRLRSEGNCGSPEPSRSEPVVQRGISSGNVESKESRGYVESELRRHCY